MKGFAISTTPDWPRQRWRCNPPTLTPEQQQACQQLSRQLKLSDLLSRLLVCRGWTDLQQVTAFLQVKLSDLHDPMLLPGIDKAAHRLAKAVRQHQPILLYGDYDVDGISSIAILYHTLTLAGAEVQTYVPHRIDEGYGLNEQAIQSLCQTLPAGPEGGVIVTVDCGITAVASAALAKEAGIDLIITDHHHFDPANLPQAFALVHPSLPGSAYPFKELCGAGVALKLAWAFARIHCGSERLPHAFRDLMVDLLSFAALGTIADIVPLVGENRIIATYGLGRIKQTANPGLNALIDAASLREEKIDAYKVGFILAPWLNACGRMDHAKTAVTLLTTAQGQEAHEIATYLRQENINRQQTDRTLVRQAEAIVIERGYNQPNQRAIVVAGHDWHQGVVGIVASRLVEIFHRPAVVLNIDQEGQAHGSARSVPGVSIYDALASASPLLASFGGHTMAAGMHLPANQIDALRQALLDYINPRLHENDLLPIIKADVFCSLQELTLAVMTELEQMSPFGQANAKPKFALRGLRITQPPRLMGSQGIHLSLLLADKTQTMRAIGFNMGTFAPQLPAGSVVDLIATTQINTWQGRSSVELILQAIRPAQDATHWELEPFDLNHQEC